MVGRPCVTGWMIPGQVWRTGTRRCGSMRTRGPKNASHSSSTADAGMTLHPFHAPADRTRGPLRVYVPFESHIELLLFFLAVSDQIVESIQGLLNAQRKPTEYLQDGSLLSRHFEDCFFTLTGITHSQSRLRGQLEEAHWASGFRPRELPGLHNSLVDPAEMMIRAFHLWQQTRWPGRNGRVRYAHTLLNLYVLRDLELLSMLLWDDGPDGVSQRLAQVQEVLDQLSTASPADQPVLVRDARWLIPLAQSPATDDLGAYFGVARNVADTLSDAERIEIHRAGVVMEAGRPRSQIRFHPLQRGVDPVNPSLARHSLNTC